MTINMAEMEPGKGGTSAKASAGKNEVNTALL